MHYASKAYAKTAKETLTPRELEASLLLKAAAKLQAVHDSWRDKPPDWARRCRTIASSGPCSSTP